MDIPLVASIVAFACYVAAAALVLASLRRGVAHARARRSLLGASAVCAIVAISNVLEQAMITDVLDPLEDVLEILFLLGFFSFIHAWQAERALESVRTQSAWLEATFSAIGAGVLTTDATGFVCTANPEMARLLGRPEAALLGERIEDVLVLVTPETDATPLRNPVLRALESGRSVSLPPGAQLASSLARPIPTTGNVSPMSDARGVVQGAVAVLRDESESTRLKEQLLHARRMDALGQLAGGIAHDFNNMLGGILGAADLLADGVEPRSKGARYVEIIIEAAENAAELTAKLLTFGRKARLDFARLDVRELVLATIAIAERSMPDGVSIALDATEETLVVVGDRTQLKSALLNLLLNARDALEDGGAISVSVRREALDREWCETSPFAISAGPHALISVRDTGTGMSPEVQKRIFEPFFTTKPEGKGTGLGLAAVFGAVESHHGAITVYSEVGRGTVFHVYLPLTDDAADAERGPQRTPRALSTQHRGRVLVVDDEAVIRATVELMLATSGFTLVVAESGARALEVFGADPNAIDVVLLDVVMPDVRGADVAEQLRALRADIPIVFASGFVRDVTETSAAHFIDKPFRRARLMEVLSEAIEAKRPP